jgi:hypothetical protein
MLSIIVSSVNETYFHQLSDNIKETIGINYEIIKVEKNNNQSGICYAYNVGAEKSIYSYLCFIHEDVKFKTYNWGHLVINHFESEPKAGLLGVAGNVCKTKMSSIWPQSFIKETEARRINIIQHYKYQNKTSTHICINPYNQLRSEVVNLDGVILITKKEVWRQNRFDDKLLKGFHGYDLDFCLQVGLTKKIFVVHDILLEHFSDGSSDITCLIEYLKVHKKWKEHLPIKIESLKWDISFNYSQSWNILAYNVKALTKANQNYLFIFSKFFFLTTLIDFKRFSIQWCKDVIFFFAKLNIYFIKYKRR